MEYERKSTGAYFKDKAGCVSFAKETLDNLVPKDTSTTSVSITIIQLEKSGGCFVSIVIV